MFVYGDGERKKLNIFIQNKETWTRHELAAVLSCDHIRISAPGAV